MSAFEQLQESYGEIADLMHLRSLASWDQQTQMPPRAAEARGQQLATLEGLIHSRITAPRIGDLIEASRAENGSDPWKAAWLRELEFQRNRDIKLPESIVKEFALETSRAYDAWVRARQEKKFSVFQPSLSRIVELSKQMAECWGYEGTPWNALVPPYERGLSADFITELFKPLQAETTKLLDRILGAPQIDLSPLDQVWSIERQREFGLRVARDIGYDMNAGRLDVAPHPFCTTLGHGDVRITTRYAERQLLGALLGTIHESGHALYEQGLDEKDARSPLYDAPSLGLHESQSRFWEVRIAHSRPFWKHYFPILQQYFPGQLSSVDAEQFYRLVNRIEPGFTRVEADEVCYNLHVIIRFEIEVRLFNGSLSVADLPAAWNELYKKYLGLDVPNDAVGCLQDIHWAYGSFGYFPTYTVGNIYVSMLVEKMEKDLPRMWDDVAAGRFAEILAWLRTNIHRHGRRELPRELVEKVTGERVSVQPLVRHLQGKYSEIYKL